MSFSIIGIIPRFPRWRFVGLFRQPRIGTWSGTIETYTFAWMPACTTSCQKRLVLRFRMAGSCCLIGFGRLGEPYSCTQIGRWQTPIMQVINALLEDLVELGNIVAHYTEQGLPQEA